MASSKRAQKKGRPGKAPKKSAKHKTSALRAAKDPKKSAKRKASALRAAKDHVRTNGHGRSSPSAASRNVARTISLATLPINTVLATAETMVRCSRPFAELPLRAAQVRTPTDMLRVQARFVQDVVSEGLSATKRFLTLAA